MRKFKVGDLVYLVPGSRWDNGVDSNPLNTVGTVVSRDWGEYSVIWTNGTENGAYTDSCLMSTVNSVIVSSEDYETSKELTDEDKSIIKEHLNE